MNHNISSRFRGSTIAILGAGLAAVAAFAVVLVLMSGTKDQTGQSASQGTTPTEQVKAPPGGTGSETTTGTSPRNQEGR